MEGSIILKRFKTRFIAHRGASLEAPENTAEAVALAWKQNVVAAEVDVQLSADGQIVVFHDLDTERMTGQAGLIKEQSWAELQKLTISGKGITTRIPLLAEIVQALPKGKIMVVEIKCGTDIIYPLKELFEAFPLKCKQLEFISFHKSALEAVKQKFPQNRAFILFDQPSAVNPEYRFPGTKQMIAYIKRHQLDGADLENGYYIDERLVHALHQEGKKLYVWTVDNWNEAERLRAMGVDGITSNRAGWMREQLLPKKEN